MHVPKTGTSFATTLMHYACPTLPEDLMPRCAKHSPTRSACVSQMERVREEDRHECAHGTTLDTLTYELDGHRPVQYPRDVHSSVAMFRAPRRRAASSFFFRQQIRIAYNRTVETVDMFRKTYPKSCATSMVLGRRCSLLPRWLQDPYNVSEAVRRVEEDFAFVGMTDHWNLSICLFHAMHGGRVHAFEFANSRPTRRYGRESVDLILDADDDDEAVFAAATRRFRRDLAKVGLSLDGNHSCAPRAVNV